MANLAKLSMSSSDDQKQDYLSTPSTLRKFSDSYAKDGRPRSASASSVRTCTTQVDVQDGFQKAEPHNGRKAIETEVAVQLSWWECLKGTLRPWRMKSRKVSAMVVIEDEHGDTMNPDDCPWIPTVHVLSKEKDESGRFVEKIAKCMIDTGNLQGNLISKTFLEEHLGYTSSDYTKLKDSDDGHSVSGHPVVPEGAVKLTWYHPSSVRIYRDMRFLVLENATHDLVLCAQAIEKHNIVNPPNFGDARKVIKTKQDKSDAEEAALKLAVEKARNTYKTVNDELDEAKTLKDKTKIQRAQPKIKPAKDAFDKAEKNLANYTTKKAKEAADAKKDNEKNTQALPPLVKVTGVKIMGQKTALSRISTMRKS